MSFICLICYIHSFNQMLSLNVLTSFQISVCIDGRPSAYSMRIYVGSLTIEGCYTIYLHIYHKIYCLCARTGNEIFLITKYHLKSICPLCSFSILLLCLARLMDYENSLCSIFDATKSMKYRLEHFSSRRRNHLRELDY